MSRHLFSKANKCTLSQLNLPVSIAATALFALVLSAGYGGKLEIEHWINTLVEVTTVSALERSLSP